jgi:hypothetical protein
MTAKRYKRGDLVVLLSIPNFEADTTWHDGSPIEELGQVHPIDRVRHTAADGSVWYDVAGWVVTAENIRQAAKADTTP